MIKEELLRKMREENECSDPFEKEVSSFSWKIGAIVALAISFIFSYLEWILYDKYNVAMFTAIALMLAIKYIIKATKIKCISYIVYSVLFSLLAITIFITYIIVLMNGWL